VLVLVEGEGEEAATAAGFLRAAGVGLVASALSRASHSALIICFYFCVYIYING
jgi:hypothetical protein